MPITQRENGAIKLGDHTHYLIEAAVSESPAGIKASWYKLTTDDPAYPDGPFYLLKPVGQKFYANVNDLTVESVLKTEAAVKPESRVKR